MARVCESETTWEGVCTYIRDRSASGRCVDCQCVCGEPTRARRPTRPCGNDVRRTRCASAGDRIKIVPFTSIIGHTQHRTRVSRSRVQRLHDIQIRRPRARPHPRSLVHPTVHPHPMRLPMTGPESGRHAYCTVAGCSIAREESAPLTPEHRLSMVVEIPGAAGQSASAGGR